MSERGKSGRKRFALRAGNGFWGRREKMPSLILPLSLCSFMCCFFSAESLGFVYEMDGEYCLKK